MINIFRRRKKQLLSNEDQQHIVAAIQQAEVSTSGEIRVYVESHCAHLNAADRASEIFFKLKMEQTQYRNGVLLYVALKDHQMAVFGDEGIHQKAGGYGYWQQELEMLKTYFQKGKIAEGIAQCVIDIGKALSTHFPYDSQTDKNELPDDIVFGH